MYFEDKYIKKYELLC